MKKEEPIRLMANIAVNVGFSLLLAFTDIPVCCFHDRVNTDTVQFNTNSDTV